MGLAEGELLRRINEQLKGELSWPEHEALLKNFLTRQVLTGRPATTPTGIPAADREWVLDRSRRVIEGLRARGYAVVGSLDELLPDFTGATDAVPDPASDDVLDAAVDTLAALLRTARVRAALAGNHVGQPQSRPSTLRRWRRSVSARLPRRRASRR